MASPEGLVVGEKVGAAVLGAVELGIPVASNKSELVIEGDCETSPSVVAGFSVPSVVGERDEPTITGIGLELLSICKEGLCVATNGASVFGDVLNGKDVDIVGDKDFEGAFVGVPLGLKVSRSLKYTVSNPCPSLLTPSLGKKETPNTTWLLNFAKTASSTPTR